MACVSSSMYACAPISMQVQYVVAVATSDILPKIRMLNHILLLPGNEFYSIIVWALAVICNSGCDTKFEHERKRPQTDTVLEFLRCRLAIIGVTVTFTKTNVTYTWGESSSITDIMQVESWWGGTGLSRTEFLEYVARRVETCYAIKKFADVLEINI